MEGSTFQRMDVTRRYFQPRPVVPRTWIGSRRDLLMSFGYTTQITVNSSRRCSLQNRSHSGAVRARLGLRYLFSIGTSRFAGEPLSCNSLGMKRAISLRRRKAPWAKTVSLEFQGAPSRARSYLTLKETRSLYLQESRDHLCSYLNSEALGGEHWTDSSMGLLR